MKWILKYFAEILKIENLKVDILKSSFTELTDEDIKVMDQNYSETPFSTY